MNDTIIEVLEPEVVTTQLTEIVTSAKLAEDSAVQLRESFATYYGDIVELREKAVAVTDATDPECRKLAREVRLGLKRVRCDVEKVRRELKADSLARGKAIDGFANILKYLCEPVETKLQEVEDYERLQEETRIKELVETRSRLIIQEGADPATYNLAQMDDATFQGVINAARIVRQEREDAERKAEAERIAHEKAEAEERERIRAENAKLKAEAQKREAEAAKERAKIEAERREEREAAEAKQRELREAADRERKAREEIERKAEEQRKAEAAQAEQQRQAQIEATLAPDRDKIKVFAATVRALNVPTAATGPGMRVTEAIKNQVSKFATWIENQAATLA
jgi:DNA repair exonuclease SbcCD ATPase subunit